MILRSTIRVIVSAFMTLVGLVLCVPPLVTFVLEPRTAQSVLISNLVVQITPRATSTRTTFELAVGFSFEWNGMPRAGRSIYWEDSFGDRHFRNLMPAEELAARLRSLTTAYVPGRDPSQAFLVRRTLWTLGRSAGLGMAFALFGGIALAFDIRRARSYWRERRHAAAMGPEALAAFEERARNENPR